jgi:uncharacterized protein YabN with tetrapyrrole methylase and pyrophosphatase domain
MELRDELGDLLFQIVFYAQVAKERSEFTIEDVVDAIHTKMVRRHPHIFGDATAKDTAEVLRSWEAIKAEEKRESGKDSGEAKRITARRRFKPRACADGSASIINEGGARRLRLATHRRHFR